MALQWVDLSDPTGLEPVREGRSSKATGPNPARFLAHQQKTIRRQGPKSPL